MTWKAENTGGMADAASDARLEEALKNFRQSVHAWSDAACSRRRTEIRIAARGGWRLASAWALGCALAVGGLGTGLYQHHHVEVLARIKAAQQARQQQLAAQQRAERADENLLATVDSDISRTVPAAMEPLAQLMDEGESQSTGN
ncbi:MAG TPA: hypothetical protein VHX20_11445 [Terracidiphilus sp.]|jgi:uncharacterized protein HemX|nr:hypothetical protein [Terracidiphilus sp.]